MRCEIVPTGQPPRGVTRPPGDKSIAHRSLLVGLYVHGRYRVTGLPAGADVRTTAAALRALGVPVHPLPAPPPGAPGDACEIDGVGGALAAPPRLRLDLGNSGTGLRLFAGALAGRAGCFELDGDASLRSRSNAHLTEALRTLGADLRGADARDRAPLVVTGRPLRAAEVRLPVASAQVVSATLLAGLLAPGATAVFAPGPCRDHTERLLAHLGFPVAGPAQGWSRVTQLTSPPPARDLHVPGDLSAAAAFIVLAAATPGAELTVTGVGLNPTRTGLLAVLGRMGADIEVLPDAAAGPEPQGRIRVRGGALRATTVTPGEVPTLLDELPLVGFAGACAAGVTEVRGAAALRIKESDRIATTVRVLGEFGATVEALPDGFRIAGPTAFRPACVDAARDHRVAMLAAVLACRCRAASTLSGTEWVATSYPQFFEDLCDLGAARVAFAEAAGPGAPPSAASVPGPASSGGVA